MDKKEIPSSVYSSTYRRYEDWKRYNISTSGEFRLASNMVLTTIMANDAAGDRYLEYNDPAYHYINVDSRMLNTCWGFAPRLKWHLSGNKSLDFGYRYEIQTNKRKDTGDYPIWTSNTSQLHSVFVQHQQMLNDQLQITSAVGLTANSNDRRDSYTVIPEPALGLVYSSSKGAKTSFGLGLSSAQPTMRQLFSYSKGNPDLKPQYSYKAELSRLQPLVGSALSFSSSIFYNDTRNLIDLYQSRYQNIYQVNSYGLEAGLNFSPIKIYELEINYAWLDYKKNSDYRLTETPKHAVDFSHRFKLPFAATLTFNSTYRHNRLSQDDAGIYHQLPPYYLHDLLLRVPWHKASLSVGMQNILDSDYQGEYGFPAEGRNYNLGIEITI